MEKRYATLSGNKSQGIRRQQVDLDDKGKLIQPNANHFICWKVWRE